MEFLQSDRFKNSANVMTYASTAHANFWCELITRNRITPKTNAESQSEIFVEMIHKNTDIECKSQEVPKHLSMVMWFAFVVHGEHTGATGRNLSSNLLIHMCLQTQRY